jgi:hypothetical protein
VLLAGRACLTTHHPQKCKKDGNQQTYCSWDPKILARLEEEHPLAFAELKVVLTHKTAVTQQVPSPPPSGTP